MHPMLSRKGREVIELEKKLHRAGNRMDNVKIGQLAYIYKKPVQVFIVSKKTPQGEPVL